MIDSYTDLFIVSNGLISLAGDATGDVTVGANSIGEFDALLEEIHQYLQATDNTGIKFLLPETYCNQLKTIPSFTGSSQSVFDALQMNQGMVNKAGLVQALNLPVTTNVHEAFFGSFDTFHTCIWDGVQVLANGLADSVFSKNAVLIRSNMLLGNGIVDPNKLLQFQATTV